MKLPENSGLSSFVFCFGRISKPKNHKIPLHWVFLFLSSFQLSFCLPVHIWIHQFWRRLKTVIHCILDEPAAGQSHQDFVLWHWIFPSTTDTSSDYISQIFTDASDRTGKFQARLLSPLSPSPVPPEFLAINGTWDTIDALHSEHYYSIIDIIISLLDSNAEIESILLP